MSTFLLLLNVLLAAAACGFYAGWTLRGPEQAPRPPKGGQVIYVELERKCGTCGTPVSQGPAPECPDPACGVE